MTRKQIQLFDRANNKFTQEKVPLHGVLHFLYKNDHFTSKTSRNFLCKFPIFSSIFGWWMKRSFTKKNIAPFIKEHDVNAADFEKEEFDSFNDFFVRKLKQKSRPIAESVVIAPCDGRYLFIKNILENRSFYVKGMNLNIADLLINKDLLEKFKDGSMLIARLAPKDYHRFHAPIDCTVLSINKSVKKALYSVSPVALSQNINYLLCNKRVLFHMRSQELGEFLMIFIGATSVGSIHYSSDKKSYEKGEEIGYFSFGGSMVMIIFKKNAVNISPILLNHSGNQMETLLLMGEDFSE